MRDGTTTTCDHPGCNYATRIGDRWTTTNSTDHCPAHNPTRHTCATCAASAQLEVSQPEVLSVAGGAATVGAMTPSPPPIAQLPDAVLTDEHLAAYVAGDRAHNAWLAGGGAQALLRVPQAARYGVAMDAFAAATLDHWDARRMDPHARAVYLNRAADAWVRDMLRRSEAAAPPVQCASPGCGNDGVMLVQLMGPSGGSPFDVAVFCVDDAQAVAAAMAAAGLRSDLVPVGA